MSSADPNPTAVVLEATYILLVRLEAAQTGEWSAAESGLLERPLELVLELVEVLKGEVKEPVNHRVRVSVTQYSSGSPRKPAAPGVWSSLALDAGTELLVFCRNSAGRNVAELLQEGSCLEVMPAQDEVDDVRLALEAERENLLPASLLAMAKPHASELGYVFTRYLWAKVAKAAVSDANTFELLLQFIELPELSLVARWSLLNSVYSAVTRLSPPPQKFYSRLAVAMFRLIEVAGDPTVTDNIIQVFLPNLLGMQGGLPAKEADDIFREYPDERPKVEQTLRSYQGNASTNDLLAWLSQGS
jgi:hypothetical protein